MQFLKFLTKYSPAYNTTSLEGWPVLLVVGVGFMTSTFSESWPGMIGLFVAGVFCAHTVACVIKCKVTTKK